LGPLGVPGEFVLTRLHARYDQASLGEDLVFEEAAGIAGGREFFSHRPAADGLQQEGQLERGSQPNPQNQFQARYIIRHPWTGDLDCEKPVRGIWGGPPHGDGRLAPSAISAGYPRNDCTFASRQSVL